MTGSRPAACRLYARGAATAAATGGHRPRATGDSWPTGRCTPPPRWPTGRSWSPAAATSTAAAGPRPRPSCSRRPAERPAAPLTQARDGHTATPLADGRVLVVGGYAAENTPPLATAEIFDPASGRWTPTAPLAARPRRARQRPPGRRAGAGHRRLDRPGRHRPDRDLRPGHGHLGRRARPARRGRRPQRRRAAGRRRAGGRRPGAARGRHGGRGGDRRGRPGPDRSARCVRPASSTRCCPGSTAPCWSSAAPATTGPCCARTEVYDPGSATFRPGPRLINARYKLDGSAVRLPDGRVVVAGGGPGAELLDPDAHRPEPWSRRCPTGWRRTARSASSAPMVCSSAATTTGST